MSGEDAKAGYDELANSIILTAAKDLRNSCKYHKKDAKREAIVNSQECYTFFFSEWFCALSSMDGPAIANMIKKEEWGS